MSNAQMQANYRVSVDVEQVNRLLASLNDKEAKNSIKSALRKSASIIRKEAQKNWVTSVPNGAKMKKDINIAVYRNASGARVDLLDKRKKGSKQFVIKFFNEGTDSRETKGRKTIKKGANMGAIRATNFFANAVITQKGNAEKSLESNIINAITKVVTKK